MNTSSQAPFTGQAAVLCLVIMISLSSFGEIQARILPPSIEQVLYLLACVGLILLILTNAAVAILPAIVTLLFSSGIIVILMIQSLWLAHPTAVAAKATAACTMFAILACVPGIRPEGLLKSLRFGAVLCVAASIIVIAGTTLGVEESYGEWAWVGWFGQKNYLGLAAVVACATLTVQAITRGKLGFILAILISLSACLAFMSHSRGAQLWLAVFTLCFASSLLGFRIANIAYLALLGCLSVVALVMVAPTDMLRYLEGFVGSSRVDLQACKLEYSIVSPK